MWKLIKLEWKKNNIMKYVRNAAIVTAVLLVFVISMAGELEMTASAEGNGKALLNVTVGLFVHMSYIVFTGVMLASFVVGAYEKKTMNLMFSYPISRHKILLSKVFAVWIFNFIAMVVSKSVIFGALLLTRPLTHITTGIRFGSLSFWMEILVESAAMVSISYISLPIGLAMKSSKAAIVASVIIVCFTQGNIGSFTLMNNLFFYAVLFVTAIFSVYLAVRNVEVKDLL